MQQRHIYSIFFLAFCTFGFAQNTPDSLKLKSKNTIYIPDENIDILAPSKAAFYSAVLPGLGQIYNKKYWKVPIVYGALGIGVYFYVDNNNLYNEFRTAYKSRIAGRPDIYDGNTDGKPYISNDGMVRAQNILRKNRDLSLFITIGLYILNIVEANVDAHLPDKALNTNITFNPTIFTSPISNKAIVGGTLSFSF